MRNLNKDEKKYINDKIKERMDVFLEKWDKSTSEKMIEEYMLESENVKDMIELLGNYFSKDVIKKNSTVHVFNRNRGVFKFAVEDYSINIINTIPPKILKDINRYENAYNIVRDIKYNPKNLNFEKYYILFSTWTAPNSERLNKINELIEIIYKDLEI